MSFGESAQGGALFDLRFTDPIHGYALMTSREEYREHALLRSTDGGNSWHSRSFGTSEPIMAIAFPRPELGFAAGARGLLLRTTDAGELWQRLPTGTRQPLVRLAFPSAETGYALVNYRSLLKTTDSGLSWQQLGFTAGDGAR